MNNSCDLLIEFGFIFGCIDIFKLYALRRIKSTKREFCGNRLSTVRIVKRLKNGKGYFPEKMQIYTRCLCKQNDVPYALVLAIIEHESGYEFDKVGDGGQSKGYMQIYEKWHTDRMERLSCTDLMNPYQNVRVGIDFLSYLLKKYGTVQDALAAYNYGEKGAREHLWSNGVYVYSYNSAIVQRMKEIEEVVGK